MGRFLVIGGSGQVGRRLVQRLKGDVAAPSHPELDLARPERLRAYLRSSSFDAILIPGAMSNIEECETKPDLAQAVNVEGPDVVAKEAKGAHVVYFSSDQVFDGLAGPYGLDAPPHPINVYGRTKLEGEKRILDRGGTVIRTCHVYSFDPGKNFFMFVARRLLAGEKVRAFTDHWTTPTDAEDLADETVRIVEEGTSGLVHLSGREGCTRYEFACEVARAFGRTGVEAALMTDTLRGKRTGLVSTLPSYREGITRHRRLYT